MGVFSFIGSTIAWLFGFVFGFIFERIDDIFVWILPCYMTVYVIKENKVSLYQNYLCFWVILALILGLEAVTFYLFYFMRAYRFIRLFFVIWLQIDYCSNSSYLFGKIKPLISKDHEKILEKALNSVTSKIDEQGGKIKEKASNQIWNLIQQNYELVKDGLFSALTTVSKKAADMSVPSSNSSSNSSEVVGAGEQNSEKQAVQKKES